MFVTVANQQTQDPLTSKMAPWPETGTEPKEPDKTVNKSSASELAEAAVLDTVSSEFVEGDVTTVETEEKQGEDKADPDVTELNDGQLKELLDEALSYRRPTDRVGKSPLFRELLQEAESDKPKCGEERSHLEFHPSRRARGSRCHASANQQQGGSLQNIVTAVSTEEGGGRSSSRRMRRGGGGKEYGVSVSARQREGGSLPSVGASPIMDRDHDRAAFLAASTAVKHNIYASSKQPARDFALSTQEFERCAAPSGYPTSLKSVFGLDEGAGSAAREAGRKLNDLAGAGGEDGAAEEEEMQEVGGRVVNYTTHATLEVGRSEDVNAVDTTVSFPILAQSALVNGNISSSIQLPACYAAVGSLLENEDQGNNKSLGAGEDTKYSSSYTVQPQVSTISTTPHKKERGNWFSASSYTGDSITKLSFQSMDDMKLLAYLQNKSVDENGNALTSSAAERKAKLRKAKPKTNHKEYYAEQVTGHRGDEDIDLLLSFIESDKERKSKSSQRGAVCSKGAAKMRKGGGKRRFNSMENLSSPPMAELGVAGAGVVRRPKKQATLDDADLRGDRRSWGTEEGQQYYCPKRRDPPPPPPPAPTEDTEFLVVTKKQRRKKQRRSCSGGRGAATPRDKGCGDRRGNHSGFPPHDRDVLYQYRRPRSPDMRRKSASSMPPSDKSDSSDLDSVHSLPVTAPTPLASYADIAKISSAAPVNINVNATKWPAITGYAAHNPQFITSSKISIGAPPVSGSRSHASVVSCAVHDDVPRGDPRPKLSAVASVPLNFKVIPPYQDDDRDCEKTVIENNSMKLTKNRVPSEENVDGAKTIVPLAISNNDVVIVRKNSKPSVNNETMENAVQANDSDLASTAVANHEDISVAKSVLGDIKSNVKDDDILVKDTKRGQTVQVVVSHCTNPRPAVIILDEKESVSVSENLTSEITFGFEINELLLLAEEDNSVQGLCLNSNYAADRTVNSATARVCENKPRKVLNKGGQKNSKANINQPKMVAKSQNVAADICENHLARCASAGEVSDVAVCESVARSDADSDAVAAMSDCSGDSTPTASDVHAGANTVAQEFAARFRPPTEPDPPIDHNTLVTYISLAWDGVLKSGGITYFSDLSG